MILIFSTNTDHNRVKREVEWTLQLGLAIGSLKQDSKYMMNEDRNALINALTILKNRMTKEEENIKYNSLQDNVGRGLTASLVVVGILAVGYVKFKETIKLAINRRNVNQPLPMSSIHSTSPFGSTVARNC